MPSVGVWELLIIAIILAPFALLVAALLYLLRRRRGAYRACPFCAESIRKETTICKHCGQDVSTGATRTPPHT
jgi:predicted amidophosphoribosyltransferase